MTKERFTYFLPPIYYDSTPQTLSLEEVWRYVSGVEVLEVRRVNKNGGTARIGTLQEVTDKVRSLTPEEYSNKVKGKVAYLPLCTFGGVFTKRETASLQETSGLVCLDIDHVSALGLDIRSLKDKLSQDREIGIRLVFTSPSGDGLKIVCKTSGPITDKESYRREFESLNSFISERYSIPIGPEGLDSSIKDLSRGCLLCFDPEAVLNQGEEVFRSDLHPVPTKETGRPPRPTPRDGSIFNPWEWDSFIEDRLIPSLFPMIDRVFPDMGFIWTGSRWESPLKLDGTSPRTARRDKSVITEAVPGVVLEQGGGAVPVIDLYSQKQGLSYSASRRSLSRLCGLEAEDYELSKRFAKMKDQETKIKTKPTTGVPATTQEEESPETKYQEYLRIPKLSEIASTKKEGIKTPYRFKSVSRGTEESLVLPSGALTLVCGKSSHGKSRFLQNLALQIATSEEESGGPGSVLYLSFEESSLEVLLRFANLKTDIKELSKFGTTNTEVLLDYFKNKTDSETQEAETLLPRATHTARAEALPKLSQFEGLYTSGRLRVLYTPELTSEDLCGLLEYLSGQMTLRAVFLDYVQAIYKQGYRKDRREELREVCKELNSTAIKLEVPIILSAQLNRETPNPSDMSGDNIAESADITRYANTILLLWDSAKGRDIRGGLSDYLNREDGKRLQERGFNLGEPGKLFAVISKNRGGTPDLEGILDYTPETGVIWSNDDLPEVEEGPEVKQLDLTL